MPLMPITWPLGHSSLVVSDEVYTRIEVEFIVTGRGVKPASVERSIDLSMETYCPVAAMLKHGVPIMTNYQIIEAD